MQSVVGLKCKFTVNLYSRGIRSIIVLTVYYLVQVVGALYATEVGT